MHTKIVLLAIATRRKQTFVKKLDEENHLSPFIAGKNVIWASSIVSQSQIHKEHFGGDWWMGRDVGEVKKVIPMRQSKRSPEPYTKS